MGYKNPDRLDWIRHAYASFKLKPSHTHKIILYFVALPERPSYYKSVSGFPVAGRFHSKKSYAAWQIMASRPELFLSATCFIPVAAAAKTDKGVSSRFQCDLGPGHIACYTGVDKGGIENQPTHVSSDS